MFEYAFTIGQDSHRLIEKKDSILMLGGYPLHGDLAFEANSDGDVFYHALTNAISGITGRNILGDIADHLCLEKGIRDSRVYLEEALCDLRRGLPNNSSKSSEIRMTVNGIQVSAWELRNISFSVECRKPHLSGVIPQVKESIAKVVGILPASVGITATTGEGLSDCGKGLGIMVFCCCTFRRNVCE